LTVVGDGDFEAAFSKFLDDQCRCFEVIFDAKEFFSHFEHIALRRSTVPVKIY